MIHLVPSTLRAISFASSVDFENINCNVKSTRIFLFTAQPVSSSKSFFDLLFLANIFERNVSSHFYEKEKLCFVDMKGTIFPLFTTFELCTKKFLSVRYICRIIFNSSEKRF